MVYGLDSRPPEDGSAVADFRGNDGFHDISIFLTFFAVIVILLFSGCRQDMYNESRYKTYAPSSFFDDGSSARPSVEGAVSHGEYYDDPLMTTGYVNGKLSNQFPFPMTKEILTRGQERYNIFCAVCHDQVGTGRGMVVQRGFPQPPSFHIDRLKMAPNGYYFDVMTNGMGKMYSYSARIPVKDRWAIVAYVRALQRSQNSRLSDVPLQNQNNLSEDQVRW